VLQFSSEELQQKVKSINIYARMFPKAKLKVINTSKETAK
jgi:Ca2+-transporting ATPase